jgi:acetyltransferase-like isoleucine patch superfamily enzyme
MRRGALWALKNRVLQILVRYSPGARTVRVWMHRRRGVKIGERVFIGTDALIETSRPFLVSIGNGVDVGIRSMILAHFQGAIKADVKGHPEDAISVRIEDEAFIGPGAIILPNVTIGYGAVVMAGSVVTRSVPPLTMVQGNPAKPVAKCSGPILSMTPAEFYKTLKPIRTEEQK